MDRCTRERDKIMNRRPLNPYPLTFSNGSSGLLPRSTLTIQGHEASRAKLAQGTRSSPNTSMMMSRSASVSPVETYLSQINEIEEGLYLCGARALTPSTLRDLGISCIINVTVELPNITSKADETQIETVKIPIEDSPYTNIGYYFERTIEKIDDNLRQGKRVLIHCVAGVSRSATITIAYLMKHRQMTLRRAYEHVKTRRQIIRPNPGFFRQLIDYETRLFGKATVKMAWNAAAGGNIPDLYEADYLNTMNFINKYGCYHNSNSHGRGEDGGFSRTWPGGPSFLNTTNHYSR